MMTPTGPSAYSPLLAPSDPISYKIVPCRGGLFPYPGQVIRILFQNPILGPGSTVSASAVPQATLAIPIVTEMTHLGAPIGLCHMEIGGGGWMAFVGSEAKD